jgi:hypothetical protein
LRRPARFVPLPRVDWEALARPFGSGVAPRYEGDERDLISRAATHCRFNMAGFSNRCLALNAAH